MRILVVEVSRHMVCGFSWDASLGVVLPCAMWCMVFTHAPCSGTGPSYPFSAASSPFCRAWIPLSLPGWFKADKFPSCSCNLILGSQKESLAGLFIPS